MHFRKFSIAFFGSIISIVLVFSGFTTKASAQFDQGFAYTSFTPVVEATGEWSRIHNGTLELRNADGSWSYVGTPEHAESLGYVSTAVNSPDVNRLIKLSRLNPRAMNNEQKAFMSNPVVGFDTFGQAGRWGSINLFDNVFSEQQAGALLQTGGSAFLSANDKVAGANFNQRESPEAQAARSGGGGLFGGFFGIILSVAIAIVLPEILPELWESTSIDLIEISEETASALSESGLGNLVGSQAVSSTGVTIGTQVTGYVSSAEATAALGGLGGSTLPYTYYLTANPLSSLAGIGLGSVGADRGGSSGYYIPSTATPDPGGTCYTEKNSCGKSYEGILENDPQTGVLGCKVADSFSPPPCMTPATDVAGTPYSYDPEHNAPGGACRGPENSCGLAYSGVLDYLCSSPSSCETSLSCFIANVHTLGASTDFVSGYGDVPASQNIITASPSENNCPLVPVAKAPTVTLSANPSTIVAGQSATLTWSASADATSCTGTGFSAGGATSNSSGISTGSLSTTSSYQIICSGAGGTSAPAIATVTVLTPEVSISAEHLRVKKGDTTRIVWSGSGVQSCVVSDLAGNTLASGESENHQFSTGSPYSITVTTQNIFKIICQTLGESITKSIIVNVVPSYSDF
jgi:hypothetical protein